MFGFFEFKELGWSLQGRLIQAFSSHEAALVILNRQILVRNAGDLENQAYARNDKLRGQRILHQYP